MRADDVNEDDSSLIVKSATASKMLSIFRQMEEAATKEVIPDGPKPLKSFTPPPDYKGIFSVSTSVDFSFQCLLILFTCFFTRLCTK